MLTAPELRKLVRAHNKLSTLKVPRGASVEEIIKLIESNGYSVNHDKRRLDAKVKRGKQITLKKADEMFPSPKKKTPAEKAEAKKKSRESLIARVIKNKDILSDQRIKDLM